MYARMEVDFRIKEELMDQFLGKVAAYRSDPVNRCLRFLDGLRVIDRRMDCGDDLVNWIDFYPFVQFLAAYAEEGYLRFVCLGQVEGGYYFDGQGNVYRLMLPRLVKGAKRLHDSSSAESMILNGAPRVNPYVMTVVLTQDEFEAALDRPPVSQAEFDAWVRKVQHGLGQEPQ